MHDASRTGRGGFPAIRENGRPFVMPRGRIGVLLIHGFAASPYDLRDLGDWLARADISVYGMRIAGHSTTIDDLEKTSVEDWRASVDEGYRTIRRYADTVFVVGDSFGGNLAIDLAHRLPRGMIAGIVTLGTPVFMPRERWKRLALPLLQRMKRTYQKTWLSERDRDRNTRKGSYNEVPLKSFSQFLNFLKEIRAQLPHLETPLLVFFSKKDRVVHPRSAEYLFRHASVTDKQLFWVEGSAHHVLESDQRDRVQALLFHFIRSHAPAGARSLVSFL